MDETDVLLESFGRIGPLVHSVCDGRAPDELARRPEGRGNPIGWLVWHLTRVQDDHVADVAGHEQVWTAQGWAERFGLALPVHDTGYGHRPEQVAAVVATAEALVGYYDDVAARTEQFVRGLSGAELDRVVDRRWDPPVTLGVRLVSVIDDSLQHVGQAAYAAGLHGS